MTAKKAILNFFFLYHHIIFPISLILFTQGSLALKKVKISALA